MYAKKVQGFVLPGQRERFRVAVQRQVEIECSVGAMACVQNAGLLRASYLVFAKEICSIKEKFAGQQALDEVGIRRAKWISRGLSSACLDNIINWCLGEYVSPPVPPSCDWLYKRKITFSGNVSTTNLIDFPVLVHLTAANFNFSHAQASGQDIRFMDSDTCPGDGTPLKHEIEKWDQVGEDAWVWVKVPQIDANSATDFIYIFYGNATAADGQDPPNVWDTNFKMVLHENEAAGDALDSTSNNCDGPIIGTMTRTSTSKINGGVECSAAGGFAGASLDPLKMTGNKTLQVWIEPDAAATGFLFACYKATPSYDGYGLYFHDVGSVQKIAFYTNTGGGWKYNTTAVPLNEFHLIHAVHDGTNIRFYYDGVADGVQVVGAGSGTNTGNNRLYENTISGERFDGKTDEMRASNIARSADWILADFKTQSETLQTYGPEEAA